MDSTNTRIEPTDGTRRVPQYQRLNALTRSAATMAVRGTSALALCALLFCTPLALGEEEAMPKPDPPPAAKASDAEQSGNAPGAGDTAAGGYAYVEITPSLIANFGITDSGRLKYLRADVSVRVTDAAANQAVNYHASFLRHALLMVLSRQDEAALMSKAGRDQIRQDALQRMRDYLQQEEGKPCVEEVLLTNFLVQR